MSEHHHHDHDHEHNQKIRESAFKAVNDTVPQAVAANTFVKVLFPTEVFDLANEYNPATSTFTPRTQGVYLVIGTVDFSPNNTNVNYRVRVEIRVNGVAHDAIDNDFAVPTVPPFRNVASVSSIIQLQPGDRVEIFATSSTSGVIVGIAGSSTSFQAARFPS